MLPSQRIAFCSISTSASSCLFILPFLRLPCIYSFSSTIMGCIPSKNQALEADSSTGLRTRAKPTKEKKQKPRGPPSPIVGEDAAPWVARGHRLLSEKDGQLIITERPS
ncbi:hypothetical protein C8Q74DRAFT_1240520 [Fomes fomentarius]|nr:hypothetical protein C8Q74DRAFT_1240520 [Fomes fomentarius]